MSPITTTTAAIFDGPGRPFRLESIEVPEPEGASILVRVVACTLCGSDLHSIAGRRAVATPTILGHEILGRVVAFGPDAPRTDASGAPLDVGDRVTWAIVASCGRCYFCRRGLPQKCESQTKYGHERFRPGQAPTGGLAGHCLLVPGTATFRIPDHLPDVVACPANCATATVAAALEAAGPLGGGAALILGCGMLGLTATAWAQSLGAAAVIAADVDPARRALAATFGATHAVAPSDLGAAARDANEGRGVDAVLDLSGAPDAIESALPLARTGGAVVLVGTVFPTRPLAIDPERVVRRCLTIRGVHNYAPRHLRAALDFLAVSAHLPFASLVGPWLPLASVNEAIAEASRPEVLRIGIRSSSG